MAKAHEKLVVAGASGAEPIQEPFKLIEANSRF